MPPTKAAEAQQLFLAALARHRAGALAEALEGYQRAVAANPSHAAAHQNLSIVLRRLRRLDEALAHADQSIAHHPSSSGAHDTRARILLDLQRPQDALPSAERGLELAPTDPSAYLTLGAVLLALKRPADALAVQDRGLQQAPATGALHMDRGVALSDLGRIGEAADALVRSAQLQPQSYEAQRSAAVTLRKADRLEEALAHFDRALALRPGDARLHNLRGTVLVQLDRLDAALAAYDRALALEPDLALAHRNRGVVLRRLRRPADALPSFDRAIALDPADVTTRWYRSFCLLLDRRFAEGWRDYEQRWAVDEFVQTSAADMVPELRAHLTLTPQLSDVAGRSVLLVGEQGVGDVIMFASAIPDLLAVAGRVALVCDKRLGRLFQHSLPGVELVSRTAAAARIRTFDTVIGVGSLGSLFRNRAEDFPGVPYLAPTPQAAAAWAARLGPADGRRRVGISWRGGSVRTGQGARSLDLAQLRPLLQLPDCEFVSLQYGDAAAEVAAVNTGLAARIRLFPTSDIDDFDDLAALVCNLDLVVSVQTSLVHLTGALGRPGLVMVPATPEWRYTAGSPTMPWYGSIRLFRAARDGVWDTVVADVAREAAARLGVGDART